MFIASALRSVLRLVGVALVACLSPVLLAQGAGSAAADGFNPAVDGNVYAVAVQADGKVLIAGKFTQLQPNGAITGVGRMNLARVWPNGQIDESFAPTVNEQISALLLQPDGKIVIGGKFTQVNGTTRTRVARLNADGMLDTSFVDPAVGGSLTPEVTSLALQADGQLIVGGGFNSAGGQTRNRIARLKADGSVDTTFNPSANNMVLSLAVQPDQMILVGGGFTSLQPNDAATATPINRIARLKPDGTLDSTFDPNADNAVSAIEVMPNGQILIGGSFLNLKPNGATEATAYARLARLNADGTLSTGFVGGADGPVSAIKLQPDGGVLVAGRFATVGTGGIPYFARLLPSGTADFNFNPTVNGEVTSIAVQPDGSAVIGGLFSTLRGSGVTSVTRNHVARVSPTGALDTDFRPDANGRLRTIAVLSNGKLLVGGSFTSIAGVTRAGLVLLDADGTIDPTFRADISGSVVVAAQQSDGRLLVGGSFSRVNGISRFNLARLNLDGSLDESYDPAPGGTVNGIVIQTGGKVVVGGGFSVVRPNGATEAVTRSFMARFNADGSLDTGFDIAAGAAVTGLAQQTDGKIVVIGDFTSFRGQGDTAFTSRTATARIDADGKLDTVFNPRVSGSVITVLVQADGKVVFGGSFSEVAPNNATAVSTRKNIFRVNADGALDTDFEPATNATVLSLLQQADGKLLVGGLFTTISPKTSGTAVERDYIARLNTDGTVDASFDAGLNELPGNGVIAIGKVAEKFILGGAFTSLTPSGGAPVARNRIARVDATGAVDPMFNAEFNTSAGAAVSAVALQLSGRILAAGSFANVNGSDGTNLARFIYDGTPDQGFAPTINGPVYAIAQQPTKGDPISTQRSGFAWLQSNGQLKSGYTLAANPTFNSIRIAAVQADGKILLGGSAGNGSSLARFNTDGTLDSTFAATVDGIVHMIVVQADGKILIGGEFTTISTVTRTNIARLNADGTLDTGFNVAANGIVQAIAVQGDNKIVIGGQFSSLTPSGGTGLARSGVARLNADGSIDGDFNPSANQQIYAIAIQPADQKIIIGGTFTTLQPNGASAAITRNYVARLNTNGTVDESFDLKANSSVLAIALQPDNKIVLGGYFTSIAGGSRNYLARVDAAGVLDAAFNPNASEGVFAIKVLSSGKLLVGGDFTAFLPNSSVYTAANATPRSRAARLNSDGTLDPTFNPNFNGTILAIIPFDDGSLIATGSFSSIQPIGSLYVGGSFTTINNVAISNLVLFGNDGSVGSTFLPNPNGAVNALLPLSDGTVVVGGDFTSLSGQTRNRLARFKADDTLDTNFNPDANDSVYAIARQSDGKLLVGGAFTSIGGSSRNYLARLNADGTVDGSFNASLTGTVRTIVVQPNGRVLVTQRSSDTANSLIRLNADGSADASFNAANNQAVWSAALLTDGDIVVGGSFTQIGGSSRSYLARLNADGSLDGSLTATPNGEVTALTLQPDAKVIVGGRFSSIDGLPRFGLARVSLSTTVNHAFDVNAERTAITWTRSGSAPEIYAAIFETSTDASTWTIAGQATRVGNSSSWRLSGFSLTGGTYVYLRATGIVPVTANSSASIVRAQGRVYPSTAVPPPVITSATAVSGANGTPFFYAIAASNTPTSYAATGLPAGLTIDAATGLISGTPTQTGTFVVTLTASNASGSGTVQLTLIIAASGGPVGNSGSLINLSVLAKVTNTTPIISGFVIGGSSSQSVLLRAVGPGLSTVGVSGSLTAPHLKLYSSSGEIILERDAWGGGSGLSAVFSRLGAFPLTSTSADAAFVITLAPGAYSIHVTDPGTTGGFALAEVYDASATPVPTSAPRLLNLSARGLVADGQIVTGGFVISGTTAKKVLVRGVGPGLTSKGVANALSNPIVNLYQRIGEVSTVIARNDDWQTPVTVDAAYPGASATDVAAAAAVTGGFALDAGSKDAAILVTLQPGVYSAQVTGSGTATGDTMVEIYEVP